MAPDVLVAGHLCVDLTPALPPGWSVRPGHLTEIGPLAIRPGGCVFNTGSALAALGVAVTTTACVGDDLFGDFLRVQLTEAGLTPRLAVSAEHATPYSIVVESDLVDRAFLHHLGAAAAFTSATIAEPLPRLVHLGYPTVLPALAERTGADLVVLLRRLKSSGVTISVDLSGVDPSPGDRHDDWPAILAAALPFVDVISPSIDDLESLGLASGTSLTDIRLAASALRDAGAAVVLVSAGSRGALLLTGSRDRFAGAGDVLSPLDDAWHDLEVWFDAVPVLDLVSTNGAGDTLTAGFLNGLLKGWGPHETGHFAARLAAAKVSGHELGTIQDRRATETHRMARTPSTQTALGFLAPLPVSDPQSLVAQQIEVPGLGPHDLLVQVEAVSVNPVDVKLRAGARAGAPTDGFRVLGYDAAGVVRAVGGSVELFEPGDEVFYAGTIDRRGTNQQLHAVDERIVGRKPTTLSFADAASLPLTAITAWETLFDRLRLERDARGTLLVIGATGGVGSVLLQLAKTLLPEVRVIATASSPEREAWVRELGADETVDHRRDLTAQVLTLAPGGVDWIFTAHSQGQVPRYAEIVRPFGHIVAIDDGPADVGPLKARSIAWHWELMFTRPQQQTTDLVQQHHLLNRVAELVDDGQLRPTTTVTLSPISAANLREAHRLVEAGHTVGKIVLEGWE